MKGWTEIYGLNRPIVAAPADYVPTIPAALLPEGPPMHTPARYRKKPVTVEAIAWTGDNLDALAAFVGSIDPPLMDEEDPGIVWIWVEKSNTRCALVAPGWVIAEVDGVGYYPCTAEQFTETYEPVA